VIGRVVADADVCIGAGTCVVRAPEHFDQDLDEGTVVVVDGVVDGGAVDAVKGAVAACPVGALTLVMDDV